MKDLFDNKKTMNIILIVLGIAVFAFVWRIDYLYRMTGGVPDSLVYGFFAAVTGEAGFMGWIKTSKVSTKEREWQLEDRALQLQAEQKKFEESMKLLKESKEPETQVTLEEEHQGVE